MINTYFVDTNVGIAYVYYPDRYYHPVKDIIENTDKKLIWSSFAQYEFETKYKEINHSIDNFLQEIYIVLINNEIYSYDFFEKTLLRDTTNIEIDDYKKIKLLEFIWNNESFNPYNPESIFTLIDVLLDCFKHEKDYYISKIILFDCGMRNYKNYRDILFKLEKNGVHYPDYIIVIDANVYSSKEQIIFLTSDEELYLKIFNADFLNIQDYELIELKA